MAKKEYRFKISGVHYAANPEAETKRLPDTEEMHVRTRELLTKIDRERPLVSLFAEPTICLTLIVSWLFRGVKGSFALDVGQHQA